MWHSERQDPGRNHIQDPDPRLFWIHFWRAESDNSTNLRKFLKLILFRYKI